MRVLADRYHFPVEDVEAARAILNLSPNDFGIRFTNLVMFAGEFDIDVKTLAEFVAAKTSGIKPWVSRSKHTSEDWERIRQVVPGGDWAEAILRLLDRLEEQSGT